MFSNQKALENDKPGSTVPLNEYFPSISDPSSMKAVRSLPFVGRLLFFPHHIGAVPRGPAYLSPLS